MKLISIDLENNKATIEFCGKQKTLDIQVVEHENSTVVSVPIGGRVGKTGSKVWEGRQTFVKKLDSDWYTSLAYGGLNMLSFYACMFC